LYTGTVPSATTPAERQTWTVLAASAAIGFCMGAFVYPMWTDNVESAQVLAGLVEYPKGEGLPMRAYHLSVYTVLIQAAALLLRLGASEWALSVFFSGLQGALACSALALFTLAVSRSATTALLLPVLLLRMRVTLPDWPGHYLSVYQGHRYPNIFPNHAGIYGIVGLFWILLVFSLFGLRKTKTASVLLGLLPAVHPALALAGFVGALSIAILLRKEVAPWRSTVLRYGAIGFGAFAATAAGQIALASDLATDVPAADVERVATAFVRLWDDHSSLLERHEWIGFFESEYYTLVLGILLLTSLRRLLPEPARIIVVGLLGIVSVAIASTIAIELEPDLFTWHLRALMIRRWLNLSSFAFVVLSIGILGQLAFVRREVPATWALAAAATAVFSGYSLSITAAASFALSEDAPISWARALLLPVLLVGGAIVLGSLSEKGWTFRYPPKLAPALRGLAAASMSVSLYVHQLSHIDEGRLRGADVYADVLEAARDRPGLLMMGDDLWWAGRVQLRTRRPVLLDLTQLNMLLKVPQSGPRMEQILKRAYGIELEAGLPGALDQELPGYDLARWQELARELRVTDVLVRSNLPLRLPRVAANERVALYTIPLPP
jgi:hypothetical protein